MDIDLLGLLSTRKGGIGERAYLEVVMGINQLAPRLALDPRAYCRRYEDA